MHPDDDDYPKKFAARVIGAKQLSDGSFRGAKVFNSKIELKSILTIS